MELTSNNISTIAVFLYTIISPILATYGVSIDQGTFTSLIIGITGLIIAIWSSRNPNTIKALGNNNTDESC